MSLFIPIYKALSINSFKLFFKLLCYYNFNINKGLISLVIYFKLNI